MRGLLRRIRDSILEMTADHTTEHRIRQAERRALEHQDRLDAIQRQVRLYVHEPEGEDADRRD